MAEIYFVEDEPDIARAVKEYLEQKGFGVRTGNTIAQAKKAGSSGLEYAGWER